MYLLRLQKDHVWVTTVTPTTNDVSFQLLGNKWIPISCISCGEKDIIFLPARIQRKKIRKSKKNDDIVEDNYISQRQITFAASGVIFRQSLIPQKRQWRKEG